MSNIKKWSDDKLSFDEITNENLVCKNCIFANEKGPVARCKKFNIKPNKVLLGGTCDEHKSQK